MHIGYVDKEMGDLILFTWRIRTAGELILARCLFQDDDFPIYG